MTESLTVGVITLFPEMFTAISDSGITRRALQQGIFKLQWWNPRDYTEDKHRTVDDRPYGGGPGMVMKVEPLRKALQAAKQAMGDDSKVIYLSPQGRQLDQQGVGAGHGRCVGHGVGSGGGTVRLGDGHQGGPAHQPRVEGVARLVAQVAKLVPGGDGEGGGGARGGLGSGSAMGQAGVQKSTCSRGYGSQRDLIPQQ